MKNCGFIIVLSLGLAGCLSAGTHGYVKAYRYSTTKHELEKAIGQAIAQHPAITQDSVKGYYNDDTNYVTITIVEKGRSYDYTFRYYGGEEYWDTSKTSEVFIAYARNEKGEGGSSGNGGIKWYDLKLKKELTGPFERIFVSQIDSVLRMSHTEE